MKRKEVGVLYATACPGCQDELAIGWLPSRSTLPAVRRTEQRRPWPSTRPDGVFVEPVTCRCGQVTLELVEGADRVRAAVRWAGQTEPILRAFPQYGSIRDQAEG